MRKIPFYSNLPDGTHCFQACLKMGLEHVGGPELSFAELDRLSGKEEGRWTWPGLTLLWLVHHGYDVKVIDQFDYDSFARRGLNYLKDKYGLKVALAQAENSDIKTEQKIVALLIERSETV